MLEKDLKTSKRADIATAFFSIKGWKEISASLNHYKGDGHSRCRLLLGMYSDESITWEWWKEDNIQRLIDNFSKYNNNEEGLSLLIKQLKKKKVEIKAVTSCKLHSKLYLFYKKNTPTSGLIGSSNLTLQGLKDNGELNIYLKNPLTLKKLSEWFDKIWNSHGSTDISRDIITSYEARTHK